MANSRGNLRFFTTKFIFLVFTFILEVKSHHKDVHVEDVNEYFSVYYAKDDVTSDFSCSANQAKFDGIFEWFFKTQDKQWLPVLAENQRTIIENGYIVNLMSTSFPTSDVLQLVCRVKWKNSDKWFRASMPVAVKDAIPPQVEDSDVIEKIAFVPGMTLQCSYAAQPIREEMFWLRDGERFESTDIIDYRVQPRLRHSIKLLQTQEEESANYTCIISNFAGQSRKSFVVHKRQKFDVGVLFFLPKT